MSPRVDDKSLELLATLVQANVDSAASVNRSINEIDHRQKVALAKTIVLLADGIEAIPRMIRSVHLDDLLWQAQLGIESARRLLDEENR